MVTYHAHVNTFLGKQVFPMSRQDRGTMALAALALLCTHADGERAWPAARHPLQPS